MLEKPQEITVAIPAELGRFAESLRRRLGHRIEDLRIWFEPHGLVVWGIARSYYDKQMAQQIVKELLSRDVAENRISVGPAFEDLRSPADAFAAAHRDHRLTARHRPHFQRFPR
jgi:hypothetical protein